MNFFMVGSLPKLQMPAWFSAATITPYGGPMNPSRREALKAVGGAGLFSALVALGLVKVLDLGEVWQRETGLPLPLGVNVMRRDLGDDLHRALSQGLRESIAWAHANVDEALEYAMRYGRGIDKETARRFVLMYVNDYTVKLGEQGMAALTRLFTDAYGKKLIPAIPPLDAV